MRSGPEWLVIGKSEWPKMQLAESPKVIPETKTAKKQETKIITRVTVQANQPQNVVELETEPNGFLKLEPIMYMQE